MKRLLSILTVLCLFATVEGQIIRANPFAKAQGGSPYCAEYTAVYNAMTIKPAADTAGFQNDMVEALVAGGYWARMDLFYCFAQVTNTNGEAWLNWINPTGDDNCTDGNTTTFTKLQGFTGSADDYLTTNCNLSSEGVHYTLNSGTLAAYSRTALTAGSKALLGTLDGSSNYSRIYPRAAGDLMAAFVNSQGACSVANNTTQGLFMATRRGASENENYRNGSSLGADTDPSSAIPNGNTYILAYNNTASGAAGFFNGGEISIVFAMDGISDAEATAINTIIEAYMDAIGKGVE